MGQRFSIRLKPKLGESLTSYILRVVHRNSIDSLALFKTVNVGYKVFQKSYAHQLDFLPERTIDLNLLSQLCGITTQQIHSMTFHPVIEKYLNKVDSEDKYPFIMQDSMEKRHRRFCPVCLHSNGYFRLIWQVKEIVICEKHRVMLTSHCPTCSKEQPYLSSNLAICRCAVCGASLFSQSGIEILDTNLMKAQHRNYSDWRSLLSMEMTQLVTDIKNYSREESLAITLLYLAQERPLEYQVSLTKHWTSDFIKGIASIIRGGKSSKTVTVAKSLQIIRKFDLKVTDLKEISVPNSFADSIYPEQIKSGICLTPWCSYFGTSSAMKIITWKKYFYNGYAIPSVCTGCYMKYGVSKGFWGYAKGKFTTDIATIQEIRVLLNSGCSQNEIYRRKKIHRSIIQRIAGYLAYHNLLVGRAACKYTPNFIPEDIVHFTKQIGQSYSVHGQEKAKKIFGWSTVEFYYYMATKEAQEYILVDEQSSSHVGVGTGRRKPLTDLQKTDLTTLLVELQVSDTRISLHYLTRTLKCNRDLLRDYPYHKMIQDAKQAQTNYLLNKRRKELKNLIRNYVEEKEINNEPVTARGIYSRVGHSRNYFTRNHPWLDKWIALLSKRDEYTRITLRKQRLVEEVNMAVEQLAADGMKINAHDIANFIGVPYNVLYLYSEVTEAMNQAKLRFNTGYIMNKYK